MGGDRQVFQVEDLIASGKLLIGDGYRAKNDELSTSGLPFARAGNINDGFRFEDADRFPRENLHRVGNKVSRPGDVVFTSKGTVGRFALVQPGTEAFVYSPQLCFWRSFDHGLIEPRFLYYWMYGREFYLQYKGVAGQTDMAEYVSLTDQRRMYISLPEIAEQRAIARILGALDDKIELNHKMNATIEAMARALFKSWFQEQSEAGAIDEKLVSDLAADGVLQVGDGYRAKNDEMASEGLPFARAGNIDNGFDFVGADLLGSPGVSKAGDKVSRACDVVFTSKGTVGRFAFVDPAMHPFVYSPQLCFWRSTNHDALNPFVLRQWMASRWFLDQVDRVKGQTDMAEYVSLRDQRAMRFPLATPESQAAIGVQLAELQRLVWNNERETHTLAHIRDKLLPRLLSGELPVDGAERVVEEVA